MADSGSVEAPRPSDEPVGDYRAMSVLAILALAVGAVAPVALIGPGFWVVPAIALLLSLAAFWRIRRYAPHLVGKSAAWVGLTAAVVFGIGGPARWISYRWTIEREGRAVARQWFEFLRDNDPPRAFQLTLPPQDRRRLGKDPWDFYRRDPDEWRKIHTWLTRPLVRTLLALGRNAKVRFCRTNDHRTSREADSLELIYAITYGQGSQRRTFFAQVFMLRNVNSQTGKASWQLLYARGGYRPKGWEEEPG